ncbi:MAG: hypothetical protein PHC97_03100 [Patescibacteria group bacterium]|nr:hypothetical protein [Patescibacteria group bacterium]
MFLPVPMPLMLTVELGMTSFSVGMLMTTLGVGLLSPPLLPPEGLQLKTVVARIMMQAKRNAFVNLFIFFLLSLLGKF